MAVSKKTDNSFKEICSIAKQLGISKKELISLLEFLAKPVKHPINVALAANSMNKIIKNIKNEN